MKNFMIGCAGVILGVIFGIAMTVGVNWFLTNRAAEKIVAPAPIAGQPDVTFTISGSYINAQLQPLARQTGLVRQATLAFASPNLARTNIGAEVAGQSINANVTFAMAVQNGRIVLTTQETQLNGLPIQSIATQQIEKIRAQAETQLNQVIQRAIQGSSLKLISVSTTANDVTLQFKTGQ